LKYKRTKKGDGKVNGRFICQQKKLLGNSTGGWRRGEHGKMD
jgi:hypothetical protein